MFVLCTRVSAFESKLHCYSRLSCSAYLYREVTETCGDLSRWTFEDISGTMSSESTNSAAGLVSFRIGQILLTGGSILFIISLASAYWVVRPIVDFQKESIYPNQTLVARHYGIFIACIQTEDNSDSSGRCGSLWENLNFINAHTARYVQSVMCLAAILFSCSFTLEVVQCLPTDRFRNFLAKNRVVEIFASIATVLVLQGMIIFAGEIKSKAEKVSGQEDEQPGWSFVLAIVGLFLCIVGVLMSIMFRELPLPGLDKTGGSWLRPHSQSRNKNSQDR